MSKEDLLTKENFGDYADIENVKRPLTEEEIASTKYAKFYDFPITNPTEEQIRALTPGNDIPVEQSLVPAEFSKLFDPSEKLCENGFCVRPEGYGFSAIDVKFPNVTWDMFQWFAQWNTLTPVNYMIWLPRFHVHSSPVFAQEDMGWGDIYFDKSAGPMITPKTFGIEDPRELDPDFLMLIGSGQHLTAVDGSDKDTPIKMTMLNYFRRCGDGIENRIRVWMGIHYIDGEIIHDESKSPVSLYERTRLVACHNAWEWTRCSTLLPELYQYGKEIGDVSSEPIVLDIPE